MTVMLSPERVGLPPPAASQHEQTLDLNLMDGERAVGWITLDRVGFGGFANEVEAAHAAWVAYRTLARRLARTHGTRPVPIDVEPLSVQRRGDAQVILAAGRRIATLVRPGPESRSGRDAFGFELRVPPPVVHLRVRSMADLIYRTLRRSGLRWALWRSPPGAAALAPAAGGVP